MTYDVVLIGTGQATGTMLPGLLEMGKSVAVIEKGRTGGTCVNWGCTPTKTLVASARAAHMVRRAGDFGIRHEGYTVDFAGVMERMNTIRNANSTGFEEWLREVTDFQRGLARFTDPHHIEVTPTDVNGDPTGDPAFIVEGETIYIHTGARARIPEIQGIDQIPYLDNQRLLELNELPEHLIILGGSYIGLEFGQIFERLGSSVTVIERARGIMTREDADIGEEATRILTDEGIRILCSSTVHSVSKSGDGIAVAVEREWGSGVETRSVEGSHLLLAAGRVPETESLNLQAAGIETDSRGFIPVNGQLQTKVPHIYAVGDVNGRGAFTHTSVHDGQVVLRNLRGQNASADERTLVYSMFVDPPLGRVGMSESQAIESDRRILKGTMPMSSINRAKEKDETGGLVKVLVDEETKEIVGAAVFGVGGDEIINMFAAWMTTGLPYTDFQKTVLVHPTVSELMPWVFGNLVPVGE